MKEKLKYVVLPLLLLVTFFSFGLTKVSADETLANEEVKVFIFRGEGCGYCAKALAWFEEIEETEGKYFELVKYEVWNDENNKALMDKVAKYFGEEASGVPYIIVGQKTWKGFADDYKDEILAEIHSEYQKNADSRFNVIEYLNGNHTNFTTYIILGVAFVVIVFIIVARNGNNATEINYEEEDEFKEDKEVKKDAKQDGEVKEKVERPKKKTTKIKTESKTTTKKKTSKK